jgi:hypothetical protein
VGLIGSIRVSPECEKLLPRPVHLHLPLPSGQFILKFLQFLDSSMTLNTRYHRALGIEIFSKCPYVYTELANVPYELFFVCTLYGREAFGYGICVLYDLCVLYVLYVC